MIPAMRIAGFPWYDLPETRAAHERLWSILAGHLRRSGIDSVPERPSWDLPIPAVFSNPRLLIAQACGYDLIYGFAGSLRPVATPRYRAPGCDGGNYRSCILVRHDDAARDLADLRGSVCAVNSFNSHSGTNALRALVAPLSRDGRFFSSVQVSDSHARSLSMLLAGQADVMAMDAVLHGLLQHHRPGALAGTRILSWSAPAPAPPFVTAAATDDAVVERLRAALVATLGDNASHEARADLLLDGVALRPLQDYAGIVACEAIALRHGYHELHATSPALRPAAG